MIVYEVRRHETNCQKVCRAYLVVRDTVLLEFRVNALAGSRKVSLKYAATHDRRQRLTCRRLRRLNLRLGTRRKVLRRCALRGHEQCRDPLRLLVHGSILRAYADDLCHNAFEGSCRRWQPRAVELVDRSDFVACTFAKVRSSGIIDIDDISPGDHVRADDRTFRHPSARGNEGKSAQYGG